MLGSKRAGGMNPMLHHPAFDFNDAVLLDRRRLLGDPGRTATCACVGLFISAGDSA